MWGPFCRGLHALGIKNSGAPDAKDLTLFIVRSRFTTRPTGMGSMTNSYSILIVFEERAIDSDQINIMRTQWRPRAFHHAQWMAWAISILLLLTTSNIASSSPEEIISAPSFEYAWETCSTLSIQHILIRSFASYVELFPSLISNNTPTESASIGNVPSSRQISLHKTDISLLVIHAQAEDKP